MKNDKSPRRSTRAPSRPSMANELPKWVPLRRKACSTPKTPPPSFLKTLPPPPQGIRRGDGASENLARDGCLAQPTDHHVAHAGGRNPTASIDRRDLARTQQVRYGCFDARARRPLSKIVKHHGRCQDRPQRASGVLAGMLWGRAMDRLEHRSLPRMDVARSGNAHPTLDHRPQVGDDVPEEIGRDDYIEPLGVLDHPHAAGIDIGMVRLNLGILFGHIVKRANPDVLWSNGIRLVNQCDSRSASVR